MRKMEKKSKNKNGKEKKKTAKKSENKGGRPSSVTPETLAKLEQAFSLGCSDLEACIYADVSPSILYRFQEKNPEFRERKEMLKQKLVLKARTVVAEALKNKDENTANGIWREKHGTSLPPNRRWLLEIWKVHRLRLKLSTDVLL